MFSFKILKFDRMLYKKWSIAILLSEKLQEDEKYLHVKLTKVYIQEGKYALKYLY